MVSNLFLNNLHFSGNKTIWLHITVIDHLDVLKKETVGARDAIRWLEAEFHKGNRLVQDLLLVLFWTTTLSDFKHPVTEKVKWW